MSRFGLAGAFAVIALLLVSGCIGTTVRESGGNNTPYVTVQESAGADPGEADIAVSGIAVENDLYHSNDVMRFNVTVSSDTALDDVAVKASGVSGKMNLEKTVNLREGDNVVQFEFGLPRCNVCGGISAGMHTISVFVSHGEELFAENSTSVEIRQ
jgi:hypothetical protein